MSGRVWLIGFLFAAVLGSALGVVYSKHQGRKLFIELEALNQERDALNVEWGQLQLEQSTWATHGRIEEVARDRLGMALPDARSAVIVRIE
ncbi:MAG: cell division protein FtsL [Chromatiales bacterium]|jgi:cell division protein FtsL|nr:cell division protein FtsL [Chromatiales bacterium]MDX9767220.1 cell division protein FtsL [Ectothiorhodospiraceae bacterium]